MKQKTYQEQLDDEALSETLLLQDCDAWEHSGLSKLGTGPSSALEVGTDFLAMLAWLGLAPTTARGN